MTRQMYRNAQRHVVIECLRCDNTANCEDASDEEVCDNVLVDPNSYNKKYPPIPEEGMAMEVKVHITIEKLHNIRELDMTYATKFTLTMEWFDSRLSFKNLLDGDLTNLVKEESKSQLWIPPLVFNNTDANIVVTDQTNAILFINKQGNHTIAPLTSIDEDFYYKGEENVLVLMGSHEMTFDCNFQLERYPFDSQICKIEV